MSLQELHQSIIEQDSTGAMETAKSLRYLGQNINSPTLFSFGMTSLQLAAMYGMLDVVLEIMLAGGNINQVGHSGEALKSPLYLALDNGHSFLTNVLVALGANLQSVSLQANIVNDDNLGLLLGTVTVDKNLLFSLAIWSVNNRNLDIFKVISANLLNVPTAKQYLQALFELAGYLGFKDFTQHISTLVQPRHVISIRTPAYWIIKKDFDYRIDINPQTYKHLTPTMKDWIITLQQLQLDDAELFIKFS